VSALYSPPATKRTRVDHNASPPDVSPLLESSDNKETRQSPTAAETFQSSSSSSSSSTTTTTFDAERQQRTTLVEDAIHDDNLARSSHHSDAQVLYLLFGYCLLDFLLSSFLRCIIFASQCHPFVVLLLYFFIMCIIFCPILLPGILCCIVYCALYILYRVLLRTLAIIPL